VRVVTDREILMMWIDYIDRAEGEGKPTLKDSKRYWSG